MTFSEAIKYLFEQLPMYQRIGASAYKNNLDNTLALDEWFGYPHHNFKSVHVAGTNGKGSVSHMLASILQEAGYCTGLYTSPHLKDFRERILVNGLMIPEDEVIAFVESNSEVIERVSPSFFEMTVAMAFDYFARMRVDVAVVEVGLGGRLDSTNIILPELSIITNIGMDHMALLGNDIVSIAREKAGIIKTGVPLIVGRFQQEIHHIYTEKVSALETRMDYADGIYLATVKEILSDKQLIDVLKSNRVYYEDISLPLMGYYQLENLQTVVSAVDELRNSGFIIQKEHFYAGVSNVVKNTGLKGRWQVLSNSPLIVCDTAHNEDGIRCVVDQIEKTGYRQLHMVIGMVSDKAVDKILRLMPKNAHYYFTRAEIPRSLDPSALQKEALKAGLKGDVYGSVANALKHAKKVAADNDLIFIGGSTFVVAEVV